VALSVLGEAQLQAAVPAGAGAFGCAKWGDVPPLLQQVLGFLDPAWVSHARSCASPASGPGALRIAEWGMLRRLGWPRGRGQHVMLVGLEVRDATWLQQGPLRKEREVAWDAFARAASSSLPQPRLGESVGGLMELLWGVPWDNKVKEAFWRLVYDGHPTPARLHKDEVCQCGAPQPLVGAAVLPGQSGARLGRGHMFWGCRVAEAVRDAIQAELPSGSAQLAQHQLWLGEPPPGVEPGVWFVVILSAVRAMRRGMGSLAEWRTLRVAPPPPHPAALSADGQVEAASRVAVAAFWEGLADYVAGGKRADCWSEAALPAPHPFIHRVAGVLAVRKPAVGSGVGS
jgi:hypothetical protein